CRAGAPPGLAPGEPAAELGRGEPPAEPAGGETGPRKLNPNSIITGKGPFTLAGVVKVNWMSTLMSGYAELSMCPTSCFVITGSSPFLSSIVPVTSHVTLGVALGTLP